MNPIYASDEQQLDFIGIGMEILRVARNELYLNMRFLDAALSSLQFVPDGQIRPIGTDAVAFQYFHPDALAELFRTGRVPLARAYLHSLLHCLFGHLWSRKERDEQYWNLACDIAVEYVIDRAAAAGRACAKDDAAAGVLPEAEGGRRNRDGTKGVPGALPGASADDAL